MNHLLGAVGNGTVRGVLTPQAPKRQLISMRGKDSFKFLQGQTTKKVMTFEETDESGEFCDYSAFLTNKGRVLSEALMMYRSVSKSWLLDVPTANVTPLLEHIQQYKMRNKIMIDTDEINRAYRVWSLVASTEENLKELSLWLLNRTSQMEIMFYQDPRFPLALRLIAPAHINPIDQLPPLGDTFEDESKENHSLYDYLRNLNGVPEGAPQIVSGSSVPFESNFDLLNAIDYDKGCYLGQELIARTHFRGAVRKRLFPLVSLGTPQKLNTLGLTSSNLIDSLTQSDLTATDTHVVPQELLRELQNVSAYATSSSSKDYSAKATKELNPIYDILNAFPTEGSPVIAIKDNAELETILAGKYQGKAIGAASASRMSKASGGSSYNAGMGAMRTDDWHSSPHLLFYAPSSSDPSQGTILKGVKPWWYKDYLTWREEAESKAVAQANEDF